MKENKKGIKRKLFSVMLALAMVLTVLPFNKLVANAAPAPTPLTFTAEEANSSVTFKWDAGSSVEYSMNGGAWNAYAANTTITLTNVGDKVSFKGINVKTRMGHFSMTGKIAASGDVTSLTNGVGGDVALLVSECYSFMFSGCTSLTSAPNLPSTILSSGCYEQMFEFCTSLTSAPALPATSLTDYCYDYMFDGCTSLISAATMSATTVDEGSCLYMYSGCTSLSTAPALPALTLAESCYEGMFNGCTSLSTAPALLATVLAEDCYSAMFYNCTGLRSVPSLSVTTLTDYCCCYMFYGCTNLIVTETEDPSEATWIFPVSAAWEWNYEMIAGLTAPGTLTEVAAGKMYKVSFVAPPAPIVPSTDNTYNKTIAETNAQLEAVAEELAKGEKVEDATVYLTTGDSLPLSVLKTLKNCPGVTLDFRCTYKGEELHFVLKGGEKLVINENIPWYGPLFLKSVYGVAGEEKQANTEVYVIRRGDSLYRIARRLGISITELLKKNPQVKNPNRIWVGQVLHY